jgi:hypothetical protein
MIDSTVVKQPIWTVDNNTIVIVQKNYARQEQITCYAGHIRGTRLRATAMRFGNFITVDTMPAWTWELAEALTSSYDLV